MERLRIHDRYGKLHIEKVYTVEEYKQLPKRKLSYRTVSRKTYLNDFITFDIETSTVRLPGSITPRGFLYHFQMNIFGDTVIGRNLLQFQELLSHIEKLYDSSSERKIVIYVHNLSYEYQFIQQFIGPREVFAIDKRKVLKVTTESGFEFRCSYKLTNMSLAQAAKNCQYNRFLKSDGDLDYQTLRTPSTVLTERELRYCVLDTLALRGIVQSKLREYNDNLHTIPITSTSYIRRICRKASREKCKDWHKYFKKMSMTPLVYTMLKEASRGGNTHANRYMAGKIVCGAESYDVQSSYPYVMMTKRFPVTKFIPYGDVFSLDELRELLKTKACLFRVLFTKLRVKKDVTVPYISYSKLLKVGKENLLDNGRVLKTEYALMTVTDIDFELINEMYEWEDLYISDLHTAEYGKLPFWFTDTIKELYTEKCHIKSVMEKIPSGSPEHSEWKFKYAKFKNLLNSTFGMCFTDPVRDMYMQEGIEWKEEKTDIKEALDKYQNSRNSFLVYAWGIWTTAHARKHLQVLIDIYGAGFAYGDTDSAKGILTEEGKKRIEEENAKIKTECEAEGVDVCMEGVFYTPGIYEHDGSYDRFITLGAKKYCYEEKGKLHVTISGVSKLYSAQELGSIENFKPGFIFSKSAGNTLWYNDSEVCEITIDGEKILTGANIAMENSTYRLGVERNYADLIGVEYIK